MEYAKSKSFEDRPTLAVVNRKVSPPSFKVSDSGSVVTIATSDLELTYDSSKGAWLKGGLAVAVRVVIMKRRQKCMTRWKFKTRRVMSVMEALPQQLPLCVRMICFAMRRWRWILMSCFRKFEIISVLVVVVVSSVIRVYFLSIVRFRYDLLYKIKI